MIVEVNVEDGDSHRFEKLLFLSMSNFDCPEDDLVATATVEDDDGNTANYTARGGEWHSDDPNGVQSDSCLSDLIMARLT